VGRVQVIKTPIRSPRAKARAECLDWLLILNRRQLERVLRRYLSHYNAERPHRALGLAAPAGAAAPRASPPDLNGGRRDLLGGLIHEYYAAAA